MDQLRLVIDTIPTLVWSCRPDGAFDYVSRRWSEYTGISAHDAMGSGWMAAYHPDDVGKHQEKRLASLASGEPVINEVRLRRSDGQYRWHLIHGVPLRDPSGNIVKWYGAASDIEDRKRTEQALRRSERELRDLIETMPAMAVAALPDGSRTFVNRRWMEYTGFSAEHTEGSGWKTAIHPDDFERWLKLWRACLADGQPFEDEARFRRASDGEYRWFWTRGVPLVDEQGNVTGWYGLGLDIQDRKTAEQERERLLQLERQAERELQLTIDTIPAIVVRHRRDGSPEFLNKPGELIPVSRKTAGRDNGGRSRSIRMTPRRSKPPGALTCPRASRSKRSSACAGLTENIAGSSSAAYRSAMRTDK